MLIAVMLVIEHAMKGWNNLWLKYDSHLVKAFNDSSLVSLRITRRWELCIKVCATLKLQIL